MHRRSHDNTNKYKKEFDSDSGSKIKMRKPPIFQISSINCPEECQILVDNIEKLGGSYDNSKVFIYNIKKIAIGFYTSFIFDI